MAVSPAQHAKPFLGGVWRCSGTYVVVQRERDEVQRQEAVNLRRDAHNNLKAFNNRVFEGDLEASKSRASGPRPRSLADDHSPPAKAFLTNRHQRAGSLAATRCCSCFRDGIISAGIISMREWC